MSIRTLLKTNFPLGSDETNQMMVSQENFFTGNVTSFSLKKGIHPKDSQSFSKLPNDLFVKRITEINRRYYGRLGWYTSTGIKEAQFVPEDIVDNRILSTLSTNGKYNPDLTDVIKTVDKNLSKAVNEWISIIDSINKNVNQTHNALVAKGMLSANDYKDAIAKQKRNIKQFERFNNYQQLSLFESKQIIFKWRDDAPAILLKEYDTTSLQNKPIKPISNFSDSIVLSNIAVRIANGTFANLNTLNKSVSEIGLTTEQLSELKDRDQSTNDYRMEYSNLVYQQQLAADFILRDIVDSRKVSSAIIRYIEKSIKQ